MKEFPILFGTIEKKLFLILLLSFVIILINVLKSLIPKGNNISVINGIGGGLVDMLSIIFPYIFKYKGKSSTSSRKCTKINIKDYSILFLLIIIEVVNVKILGLIDLKNVFSITDTFIELCFKMIFYIILSIIILKSKYYIHNIISLILFCIFTIISDIIFGYLAKVELASFISLIPEFIDDILSCYMKYLMDKKYYSYWNILFFFGLFYFIIYIFQFIIIIINDPNDNSVFNVINNGETKYIIINFFLDVILSYYCRQLLVILVLEFYSLNHAFMSLVLYFIVMNFINCVKYYEDNKNNLFFLIPAFFQIISLLFFVEILEFNFCNLNKNTKRNIMLRQEQEEMLVKNPTFGSNIEVDDNVIVHMALDKKNYELNELIFNDEKSDN